MERTISKPTTFKVNTRACFIRVSRTDPSTPGPDDDPPGPGPNVMVTELTLNGAGDARCKKSGANIPKVVQDWIDAYCDEAAEEL